LAGRFDHTFRTPVRLALVMHRPGIVIRPHMQGRQQRRLTDLGHQRLGLAIAIARLPSPTPDATVENFRTTES